MKNQSFINKLYNAIAGLRSAWQGERNFQLQVILGLVAVAVFAAVRPAVIWWALIALCIVLVLAAELVNSAIETLADHLHPELHPVVGKVKDMLAGMVLVISIGTVIVAVLALCASIPH